MSCNRIWKAASERLDWIIVYSRWLIDGDAIASATVAAPSGLTVDVMHDDVSVTLWFADGDHGKTYKVPLTITSQQGRVLNEIITVRIE